MADKSRNFSGILLVLALIGAALFYGCGSSVSNDYVSSSEIDYSITGSYKLPNGVVASARMSAGTTSLPAGVTIYSEAEPSNIALGLINESNKYIISKLNPNLTHNVVFKYSDGLNTYIARSETPIVFEAANPTRTCNDSLAPQKCEIAITGRLLDSAGKPLQFPSISLWGQNAVNYDPTTGVYTTPLMPKNSQADLIVKSTAGYQQTVVPLSFTENPSYHESVIPTTTEKQPPTVEVTLTKQVYPKGSTVYLTAKASDSSNEDLNFECNLESCESKDASSTVELLAAQSKINNKLYSWKSPDDDCLATLTVRVTNPKNSNLSATAKIKVTIGSGIYKPNTDPTDLSIVVNTTADVKPSAYYGLRTYSIVANASDSDGDRLTYSLTLDSATGDPSVPLGRITPQNLGNEWRWDTPDLSAATQYKLTVVARDQKGHKITASEVITLKPTQANEPPTLVKISPADGTLITSGQEIELKVLATDPEEGPLYYKWTYSSGDLAEPSIGPSARWIAPIINTTESKSINVKVSDDGGLFATATFVLEVKPDPNKKAPEAQISFSRPNPDATYNYNGNEIPLYKTGETIVFTGVATDTNYTRPIDAANFTWYLLDQNGTQTELGRGKGSITFTPTISHKPGNYAIKLLVKDLTAIPGESIADFRINTAPIAEITWNGYCMSPNGRMDIGTTPQYTYTENNKNYDVFQASNTITLVASCTDAESPVSVIEDNCQWISADKAGKTLTVTPENGKLNTVTLQTTDSKGVTSALSEYSFFVNTPPVIALATSTNPSFINTDNITLQLKVKDDAPGINVEWFERHKPASGTQSAYASYKQESSTSNELNQSFVVNASTFMTNYLEGKGGDMTFKIVATDSMGLSTETEITLSIVDPHTVNVLEVASGTYDRALDQDYDSLVKLTAPYTFAAKQPFSIRGSVEPIEWMNDMNWSWTDTWIGENGTIISSENITNSKILDGNILNGYNIQEKFGTHTVRLTAKSLTHSIVASNSVDVFINSTPAIKFASAKEGDIMRFDTGKPANFTLSITEDNPQERLGLIWTIVELNDDAGLTENTATTKVYVSHDLDPDTASAPISMNNNKTALVTVGTAAILGAGNQLASGAYRIRVCAYDEWNAAATATVDVLFNTLPTFDKVGTTDELLTITVPDYSDNGEDYRNFVATYTTIGTAPVYLVNKPTMFLKFRINASDTEAGLAQLNMNTYNDGYNIMWKFSEGAQVNQSTRDNQPTYSEQGARFGIGKNTVTAEIRDTFYDRYGGRFNTLSVASYSKDFYIWQSTYGNLAERSHLATNIFQVNNSGSFYVQYGKVATYTEAYQIVDRNQSLNYLVPGKIPTDDCNLFEWGEEGALPSPASPTRRLRTEIGRDTFVIAMMPFPGRTNMAMLTNTPFKKVLSSPKYAFEYTKHDTGSLGKEDYESIIYNNMLVYINNFAADSNESNRKWIYNNASSTHTFDYPDGDLQYMERVISMTNTDDTGSMLLKGWTGGANGAIAPFSGKSLSYLSADNNTPFYCIDSINLNLTDDSKVRYLNNLKISQKLFFTDTLNNRIVKLNSDYSNATSIPVERPIDIAQTDSKYVFTLSESTTGDVGGINLFNVTNSEAIKVCEPFAKLITGTDATTNRNNTSYRAGKLLNPKAIYFYADNSQGSDVLGGLVILEEASDPQFKSRVQIIRTNMKDWTE